MKKKMPLKILGISGSLRENSSNTNILKQMGLMHPGPIELLLYNGLGGLPHFNPELDLDIAPPPVAAFRQTIKECDAVIICTPEYAFGVPGSLKNALDWIVSTGEFVNKPFALITASLSGEKAHKAMLDILTALSVSLPPERALLIPFIRSKLDSNGYINVPDVILGLESILNSFQNMDRS